MECKQCNNGTIVNSFFKLCHSCNNIRLHGSKYGKQRTPIGSKSKKRPKSLFVKVKNEDKGLTIREKDAILYEAVFNKSNHKCEECNEELNTKFRDTDGNINWIWTYSHIVQKSIAPKLRHLVKNINRLCMNHHRQWENGDRESMNIYEDNVKRFPQYLKKE